ncbi:MAG: hypothetical protein PHW15_02795 [Patescibacteria group bacterium]|nr:hypothetical protein [Patescibacteria group bacterium]
MKFVFLRKKGFGRESLKGIKTILEETYGRDFTIVSSNRIPVDSFDCLIRWGCTANFNKTNNIINKATMIHSVSNKIKCRMELIQKEIPIPKTYFSKEEIQDTENIIWPLIGREMYHSQGKNIAIVNNLAELAEDNVSNYWSEYINKDKEYRVYVFFGRIIKIDEKIPTDEGKERIAWNHANGGSSFKNIRWNDWPLEICKIGIKTSEAIGIDFSGIDIIVKDNKPFVLELNSAPSINTPYGQTILAKAFNWVADIMENTNKLPEHFEYPQKIKGYKAFILPAIEGENC